MGSSAITNDFRALVGAVRDGSHPSSYDEEDSSQRRKVLFVTPESADFIKVGGLGDVSAALPRAMSADFDVRVMIPGYPQVVGAGYPLIEVGRLPALAGIPECELARIDLPDGLIVYVLVCPELFEREGSPYLAPDGRDWDDNHIRFGRLSLAAAQLAAGVGDPAWQADLLHLNDWPTALAAGYLHWWQQPAPCVFTIHNLAYQGLFPLDYHQSLGIPPEALGTDQLEFYGNLSFMKAGLVHAEQLTTVSATYAREITTEEFGCGLERLLRERAEQGRLCGIANGIDDTWDPQSDAHLLRGFGTSDWIGKRINCEHLRQMFGLAICHGPLFAVVSRLVHQKGVDLTIAAAESIVRKGGQLVVIGRGEPSIESALRNLAARFPGAIGVRVGFSEREARCIFAGSDFLLMPSRFEPCGLSQMYAQRFGSLPIAHRTGGLVDTIEDGVTGFLFDRMTVESFKAAINRAFSVYRTTDLFYAMRRAAMGIHYHWSVSSVPYAHLYRGLIDRAFPPVVREDESKTLVNSN